MSENFYFFSVRFKYSQSNELRTKLYELATNTNPVIKYTSNRNHTAGYRLQSDKWKCYAAATQHLCVMHIFYEKLIKKHDHIKQILPYCLSICEANERYWYLSVMSKNAKILLVLSTKSSNKSYHWIAKFILISPKW